MKTHIKSLIAATCLVSSISGIANNNTIYFGGDYSSAGLYSLSMIQNLTNTIASITRNNMTNTSAILIQ